MIPKPDFRTLPMALLGLVLAAAGCAGPGHSAKPQPAPAVTSSPIDELNLVSMPMAINVNSQPGSANGIAVKVYALDRDRPKTQRIAKGTLELVMFDGIVTIPSAQTNRVLRTWSFPASELASHGFVTAVGTGYFFSLGWGKDRPHSSQLTVVARFLPPHRPRNQLRSQFYLAVTSAVVAQVTRLCWGPRERSGRLPSAENKQSASQSNRQNDDLS